MIGPAATPSTDRRHDRSTTTTRASISGLGAAAQTREPRPSTRRRPVVNTLGPARRQVSGVSLDEEMTNLVQFQHAYAAAGAHV